MINALEADTCAVR